MGSLKYAVAGAAVGLGNQIVKMADERRAMAKALLLQKNRADARAGERAEDRELDLADRDEGREYDATIRKQKRLETVEDRNYKVANRRPLGLGLGEKPVSISKDMLVFLEDEYGPDVGYEASRHMRRLMNEARDAGERLGEQDAYDILRDSEVYEEEITDNPPGPFNETTRIEKNRERRGKFLRFDLGGGATGPDAVRASPADTAHIPPDAIEHLRQNPGLSDAFDEQFGPGAAAAVLGGG